MEERSVIDTEGNTLLHLAVLEENSDKVSLLLRDPLHANDINIQNEDGQTPLLLALSLYVSDPLNPFYSKIIAILKTFPQINYELNDNFEMTVKDYEQKYEERFNTIMALARDPHNIQLQSQVITPNDPSTFIKETTKFETSHLNLVVSLKK